MSESIRPDCHLYNGYKPCGRAEDCAACPDYAPLGPKVLIVKLGALGDVLRTTPLLTGLREQVPGCRITWITSPAAAGLLKTNRLIDRLWLTGAETLARLQVEVFDRVVGLDKEPEALALASLAKARARYGFGLGEHGNPVALNEESVYSLRLGLSDELKFRQNTKTYQELIFESAELVNKPEYDYVLNLPAADQIWADEFLARKLGGRPWHDGGLVIGFNLGGGDVFVNKRWREPYYLTLRRLIQDRYGDRAKVLALGGRAEAERMDRVASAPGPAIVHAGSDNSLTRFAALLKRCHLVLTGDSLGMHLALATGSSCLLLIGSTTWREIELYGRGEMIVSDLDCSPCYRRHCRRQQDGLEDCMGLFTPDLVMERLAGVIERLGLSLT